MFNPAKKFYEVSFSIHGTVALEAESEDDACEQVEESSIYTLADYIEDIEINEVTQQ